jgi:hypothetical protein
MEEQYYFFNSQPIQTLQTAHLQIIGQEVILYPHEANLEYS